jgi:Cytochrome b(C-terminal)/b6/petD
MFSAILIILSLPFTDLRRFRGMQFNHYSVTVFFFFLANLLILMVLGAKHVESPFIQFGQISAIIYFLYFSAIPLISLIENTLVYLKDFTNIGSDDASIRSYMILNIKPSSKFISLTSISLVINRKFHVSPILYLNDDQQRALNANKEELNFIDSQRLKHNDELDDLENKDESTWTASDAIRYNELHEMNGVLIQRMEEIETKIDELENNNDNENN